MKTDRNIVALCGTQGCCPTVELKTKGNVIIKDDLWTQKSVQPAPKPSDEKKRGQTPTLDVGKVKIVPLPRRNDDIYMRTLRRRRA